MPKTRPNILFLQAEDVSRHHGCYGDTYAHTPNIDRLAAEGCRYTNAITHTPVCAPSRSGMVTGMYPWAYGVHHMRSTLIDPPRLFTHELQDAGYDVHWPTKTDFNFDPPADFATTRYNWFERGALPAGDKPWLAYYNFGVTHESQVWDVCNDTPREPFAQRQAELPPEHVHDPADAPLPPYLVDAPGTRQEIARHYDNLSVQDMQVGRALAMLEASGQADHTIVIYLSDHGRGLCREKRWCYEAGVHLPLIIRWPGTPGSFGPAPGSVDDQLVAWVDIAPTLLAACGLAVPDHYHGRAFTGDSADAPQREYAFVGRDRMGEAFDLVRGARSKQFLYLRNDFPQLPYMQRVRYMEHGLTTQDLRVARRDGTLTDAQAAWMADTKPAEELYDVDADPHCVHNLAGDPALADTMAAHRDALAAMLDEHGDHGRDTEEDSIAQGLIANDLDPKFRPQVGPLLYQFQIGKGNTVVTMADALERYGPSSHQA